MTLPDPQQPPAPSRREGRLLRLLKVRVWVFEHFRPSEQAVTLFWAGLIGFLGATSSLAYKAAVEGVHRLVTGHSGSYVETFAHLSWWERLLIPAAGGALAGLVLQLGRRIVPQRHSTDYMEAIVIGEGVVPVRATAVKCASALFTIASGGSIGREGPLVQLSSMLASVVGRLRSFPTVRKRLLVACGAAAGIAAAYNAPIGGAMFVAEIILGSVAMESFGPLVFASVISTLTIRHFYGSGPLYQMYMPAANLNTTWEIIPYMLLGLVAGVMAPWFLRLLRGSEAAFSKLNAPPSVRLTLGGLLVGAMAMLHPEVCGNGYSTLNELLHGGWLWQTLLVILAFKLFATAVTFGSGAVGGVFTPTLFSGACLGYLFAQGVQTFWPGPPLAPIAFAVVGMGAFLAATTHAPLMAIIMLFELTLNHQLILPLMLACVIAHYASLAFEKRSIYADSLLRKGSAQFEHRLEHMLVGDLMKTDPVTVRMNAPFTDIAQQFVTNRFNYLYVTDPQGLFKGAISLHDIKSYLHEPDLAALVIAGDIVRSPFPTIGVGESMQSALEKFSRHDGERLPVLAESGKRLIGSLAKTDLLLALAERQSKPETA